MKLPLLLAVIFTTVTLTLSAQGEKPKNCKLAAGADLTSMYLWRGFELSNGPAIQPWGEFSFKGFTLGAWGSYNISGDSKEVDVYARYDFGNMSLSFTDLYTIAPENPNPDYFDFNTRTTGHVSELGLSYNGSDKIPFTAMGGVLLYGLAWDQKVNDSTSLNYSSYFEFGYLGQLKDYSYNVFAGFTPTESYFYGTRDFSFINVGINISKEIKVTESFAIPATLTLSTNPDSKKVFMAFMVSF